MSSSAIKAKSSQPPNYGFGPQVFKSCQDIPHLAVIQRHADSEIPIEKALSSWAVGTDPAMHIKKVHELFDSGVTIVNIHSGQSDQKKLLEFYKGKCATVIHIVALPVPADLFEWDVLAGELQRIPATAG